MRTYVSDTVDGMRAWYSRLSTIDFTYVWFPIVMVLVFLAQITSPSGTPHPAPPLNKAIELLAIVAAVIGVIAAVIRAIAWLRKRFFPVGTFAIGQGLSRHQHNEQIRWVAIVGFVVGVGASIVATMLLS